MMKFPLSLLLIRGFCAAARYQLLMYGYLALQICDTWSVHGANWSRMCKVVGVIGCSFRREAISFIVVLSANAAKFICEVVLLLSSGVVRALALMSLRFEFFDGLPILSSRSDSMMAVVSADFTRYPVSWGASSAALR